uniref:Sema domain-containing protein n=1 Tax=Globodera rostochiensis TaxID=31243 RepID=A0A914ID92_GLORO
MELISSSLQMLIFALPLPLASTPASSSSLFVHRLLEDELVAGGHLPFDSTKVSAADAPSNLAAPFTQSTAASANFISSPLNRLTQRLRPSTRCNKMRDGKINDQKVAEASFEVRKWRWRWTSSAFSFTPLPLPPSSSKPALLLFLITSVFIVPSSSPPSALFHREQQNQHDPAILAVFRDIQEDGREAVKLQRMVMDRSTGRLYVGAVNRLYDLSPDGLAIREQAITGPRADSILCADALSNCKEPLVPTNSHTKALVIYAEGNKLIECTSLYQGRCRTRNLSNIRRESDVRFSRPGLVANDAQSSTAVFVGTGPVAFGAASARPSGVDSLSQPAQRVLYVASTYVPVSQGPRDALDVPALASLTLEPQRLFEFTSQSISSGTFMKLDYRRMPFFKIDYVGGFEANGFAYFATRQPKYTPQPDPQPIISKLVRVCTQDPNFYSYTEAPLECEWGGSSYNLLQAVHVGHPGFDLAASLRLKPTDLVLFAAFARGEGAERNVSTRDSAICAYSLRHIEAKFFENIRLCYNGNTRTNLPWFNSDKMCTATRYPDSEIMCGKDVNSYIGGEIPISARALLVDRTSQLSALAVSSVQTATVAFIGTSDGVLHKALIEGEEGQSHIFKSIQLSPEGQPLLGDMELDEKNGLLYAMSSEAVYKVNVRLCAQSPDCHSCLRAGDPYCGWCLKPSACTTQEVCDADALNPRADWLNYKSGRCPYIRSVEPREQQITISRPLHVRIENAPPALAGQNGGTTAASELYCSFQFPNQQLVNVSALSREAEQVVCATPTRPSLLTLIASGQSPQALSDIARHGLLARLSVVQSADAAVLASTNFTFFDCHQLNTCSACASARFPCDWCALTARCVPNAEDVCQGETLVNSISRVGPSSRRGPEFCAHFTVPEGDQFLSSGKRRSVSVQAHNLHDQMGEFKCRYSLESAAGVVHEKLAQRKEDRLICEDMLFEFSGPGDGNGTVTARFDILWASSSGHNLNQFHPLDNAQGMRVVIYKCGQLAPNCGLCLGLDVRRFECGWCEEETPQCVPRDGCKGNWLSRGPGVVCPNPHIDDFEPKKGPINGGTRITISGTNLGLSLADVRDAVRVASARCDVIEHEYEASRRIICHTRAPSTRQKQGQHVVVRLREDRKYTAVSSQTFTYTNPQITSFQPYRGPRSGGTDLTILGTDLDSGALFNLSVGNVPCQLRQRSSSMAVCRTGATALERPEYLVLNADGTQVRVESVQFQYMANPSVERVPRPVSTVSGGIQLDVQGKALDLLQRARMLVVHEGQTFWGARCEGVDEHLMVCRTPPLEMSTERKSQLSVERPLRLDYGFDLDGTLTGNLTTERAFPKLLVFADPRLHALPELLAIRPGGDLVLKGQHLNLAASPRDVRVSVGGLPCNVSALASNTLTCVLPAHLDEAHDDAVDVLVYIGDKIEKVGEASQRPRGQDPSEWLILAVAVAFLGVFLALALFVLYRRKSTSHNRQLRYLKAQMNSIEMRVAQECKEAFHELQTNINALAGSVPQGMSFIPFLPYAEYAARILFPNYPGNAHPALCPLSVDQDRALAIESGLRQLHYLLQNRHFLDRVYVGSLLMVILQEKMAYCTEVLKQLLKELIRRNADGKFHPKILFRRAESVAERMLSTWFAFLMYKFVRRFAGKPLYQLYWATKQQTEKGPQDAITMDARYSLSEEKLLRASIDFRELTLFVLADCSSAICDTQVRVLDCDSISQVKGRCLDAKYRTTPYSERPLPSEVDLELRTATHRMLLQDLDGTSRCENGFWRYNTLAHYKVEDKATLALVPHNATSSSYNLSLISDKSDKSSGSGGLSGARGAPTATTNSPVHRPSGGGFFAGGGGTGSSTGGHSREVTDSGATLRAFHLVKPMTGGVENVQDGQEKMVTEIYLTRLLTMKGTLQRFIEDLLETVFSVASTPQCPFPPCIKYLFDFLDDQAHELGITDPEVVHAWKSNALPLRFWVNLIKNPDFIFDIQKANKIEGSLNVVAQTLMDACSTQEQHLTKDSPSSKLLFANEMDKYRQWVQRYYATIASMEPISQSDMSMLLAEESQEHSQEFMLYSALNELYAYVSQNKEMLFDELAQNEFALQQQLPGALQKLLDTIEAPPESLAPLNGALLVDAYADSKARLVQPNAHLGNGRFY